jgi:drug/metabolite transporter (DMT)-like permease
MKLRYVYFMLTLSAFFWGATFNFAKYSVQYLNPPTTAALRFTLAGLIMAVILAMSARGSIDILKRNWRSLAGMAAFGVFGFNTFFFLGMRFTSPTNGSLIQATNPLVTAVIAGLFFGEPISRNHKVGTSISFLGVLALIMTGSVQRLKAPNIGDVFCLIACICFAFYAILGKRYLKGSTPVATTGLTTIIGVLPLWIVAAAVAPRPSLHVIGHVPWEVYAAILFMGALGSVLAYIFWNYGISRIGVADTAVFFHLVPVFTVLLSFILGQSVTGFQIAAGIVVMAGVAISHGSVARIRNRLTRSQTAVPASLEAPVPEATIVADQPITEAADASA